MVEDGDRVKPGNSNGKWKIVSDGERVDRPIFVNKIMKHWWEDYGKVKWFTGCVLKALGDNEKADDCQFEVKYSSGVCVVKLIEDWLNGDVRILRDVECEPSKKKSKNLQEDWE